MTALVIAGCSASHAIRQPPPPQPDVVLIAHLGFLPTQVPNEVRSVSDFAKQVPFLACEAWLLNPYHYGGTVYEVHLRVPAASAVAVSAQLSRSGRVKIVTEPVAAYSVPPVRDQQDGTDHAIGPESCI